MDGTTSTSRRALFAGAVAGVAGWALQSLGGPRSAAAADGDPVRLGQSNAASTTTVITAPGNACLTGSNATGIGLSGFGGDHHPTIGIYGHSDSATGVGVSGHSGAGTGGRFASDTGDALEVKGRAAFSRAGVVQVPAGRAYVDVTVAGGIKGSTGIIATLQTMRTGVQVAAVRRNYPSPSKARIYLNKTASASAATPVAWFAFD